MSFLRLLPLVTLLLCSCDRSSPQAEAWKSAVKETEKKLKIEELEREIESSEHIISDLDAAVLMERTKLEDNPNYDQTFLEEILSDQGRERKDINEAQEQLDQLQK